MIRLAKFTALSATFRVLGFCLVCLVFLPLLPKVQGQTTESSRLYIKGEKVTETYIAVTYELNYPGFVEIHLTNSEGRKVWIHGKVADKGGIHEIRISRKPMESGERYSYTLKYKGKDYSGSFYNEEKEKKDS